MQTLAINCVWGDWEKFTSCSKTCGGGIQIRTRIKTTDEQNGGTCDGGVSEVQDCNTDSCSGMPGVLNICFRSLTYYNIYYYIYKYVYYCPILNSIR